MDKKELLHLKKLAAVYAEYAHGEVMQKRRDKWRLNNGLAQKTYPFHIEDNGTFLKDLMPALQCTSDAGRYLENCLLYAIVSYEKINDDRIIPDRFVVDWITENSNYCEELAFIHTDDGHGGALGYETNKPIKDIDGDFAKLKKVVLTLKKDLTVKRSELADEVFRGLLPVVIAHLPIILMVLPTKRFILWVCRNFFYRWPSTRKRFTGCFPFWLKTA